MLDGLRLLSVTKPYSQEKELKLGMERSSQWICIGVLLQEDRITASMCEAFPSSCPSPFLFPYPFVSPSPSILFHLFSLISHAAIAPGCYILV